MSSAEVRLNPSEHAATCAVCSHLWETHDPIAKRFCSAMEASGNHRRCVCSGAAGGMTYSNSTKGPIST